MALHPKIADVTARIEERSGDTRRAYLDRIDAARNAGPGRQHLSCGNLAHAFAAVPLGDKLSIRGRAPNIGLVTSYTIGGFIHALLVVAVIMVLIRIIQGRGNA